MITKKKEPKFRYGDFITLKIGADVVSSIETVKIPTHIITDGKLWAVDAYEQETGMLNINRVLEPHPGAYCSWVHEKYVILVKRRGVK